MWGMCVTARTAILSDRAKGIISSCECLQYAVDTVLFAYGNNLLSITENLQNDLNMLVNDVNQPTINANII